jgi:transposase
MPGLLRGVARTAVIAGTATAVSNNVSRRQAQRWQAEQPQEAAPEPVAAAPAMSNEDQIKELQQLAQLKDQGILTQEEFDAKKKQILGL